MIITKYSKGLSSENFIIESPDLKSAIILLISRTVFILEEFKVRFRVQNFLNRNPRRPTFKMTFKSFSVIRSPHENLSDYEQNGGFNFHNITTMQVAQNARIHKFS